jgi:hypothetical protein
MRVKRLTTWLVLGIAVALADAARRRRGGLHRRAVPAGVRGTPAEIDPTLLGRSDEAGEMFVEAIAGWDAEPTADLGLDEPPGADAYGDRGRRGAGDLYGVHVTPAIDRDLPDDDRAQAEGESWLEHLNATAAEVGPEPEHVLDMLDDSDPHAGHHKRAKDDVPVADHGSGGPRGL